MNSFTDLLNMFGDAATSSPEGSLPPSPLDLPPWDEVMAMVEEELQPVMMSDSLDLPQDVLDFVMESALPSTSLPMDGTAPSPIFPQDWSAAAQPRDSPMNGIDDQPSPIFPAADSPATTQPLPAISPEASPHYGSPPQASSSLPQASSSPAQASSSPAYSDATPSSISDSFVMSPSTVDSILADVSCNNIVRQCTDHAFNFSTFILRFTVVLAFLMPDVFFTQVARLVEETLDCLTNMAVSLKLATDLSVTFVRRNQHGRVIERTTALFTIPAAPLDQFCFDNVSTSLLNQCLEFESRGSNWQIEGVNFMEFDVAQFQTIRQVAGRGGSVTLPPKLKAKQAVVNVENQGDDCFKYALLSVLHYQDVPSHRQRPIKYAQWLNEHNWEGMTFPMTAGQLSKFEKQNPGIVINLLEWRGEKDVDHPVHRIRVAPIPKTTDVVTRCVSILAIPNAESWHYVGVANINRLLNTKKSGNHRIYCERCFKPLFKQHNQPNPLEDHLKVCYADRPDSVKMPIKDHLLFENYAKTQQLPYVMYGDIECYLKPDPTNPNKVLHVPCAIGLLLVSNPESKFRPLANTYKVFTGDDCLIYACQYIHRVSDSVYQWNKEYSYAKLTMTAQEHRHHFYASACFMCETLFSAPNVKKVREHDHVTGKYRGAACQDCNTKMRLKRNVLPIFFHNLRNYDSHLLFKSALGVMTDWEISVIPMTKEKYISFSAKYVVDEYEKEFPDKPSKTVAIKMNLEFKDSVQFLQASLDTLVRNLDVKDLALCKSLGIPLDLVQSKGIFPYEWFDSLEKLNCTSLPPREDFYDRLNLKECSEADYAKAQAAWQQLNCQTFKDYMLGYLKLDVFQLADVFQTFRKLALGEDGLDPAHFFTLPGLALDSALKMTRCKLDLIKDQDTYEFIEQGIRGGFTFVNDHFLSANASDIDPNGVDVNLPRHEMLYIDANNLYGHALSKRLPKSNFQWLTDAELLSLNVPLLDVDGDTGYLFEVDLEYPANIHDRTKDFPLAPEKLMINQACLSTYMKSLSQKLFNTDKPKTYSKLLLTQFDKEKYIVHAKLLQFYLRQGLKIVKIHRVLKYTQDFIFRDYIEHNSKMRQLASNTFVKDYYKLKNNALYGKTVENVRRRINFRICNNEDKFTKLVSNPSFLKSIVFDEDLVGVHLAKEFAVLNKPVYVGQAVLDLAKLEMYELYYDKMLQYEHEFACTIRVVGGDTDSFFLSVQNCDLYQTLLPAMKRDNLLDSSNFAVDHPLFSTLNKAKLGCVKDESEGWSYREWVLLKPKCYSMLCVEDAGNKKRAKGVRRATVRGAITHHDYVEVYKKELLQRNDQIRFASTLHEMHTLNYNKISLSIYEDKRCWINCNESLPYGHYTLNQSKPKRLEIGNIPIHVSEEEPPSKRRRTDSS